MSITLYECMIIIIYNIVYKSYGYCCYNNISFFNKDLKQSISEYQVSRLDFKFNLIKKKKKISRFNTRNGSLLLFTIYCLS